jgi:hypothetical protein
MTRFIFNLSKAERRALRILAALEDQNMGEFTRDSIRAKWAIHYPDYPLGDAPHPHGLDNKKKHNEKEDS